MIIRKKKLFFVIKVYIELNDKYGFSITNHALPDGAHVINSFIPRSVCIKQILLLMSLQHNFPLNNNSDTISINSELDLQILLRKD